MFTVKENDDFEWPVDVRVPSKNGEHKTHRFRGIFREIPADRFEEIMGMTLFEQDKTLARECLVGWKDVKTEEGADLDFNEDTRDMLLQKIHVRTAIIAAYTDAFAGKARRKN